MRALLLTIVCFWILTGCVSTSSLPESTKNVFNPKASEYNTQLGIGYLRQGNYERAKQKLLLALKQNPDSSEANSAMAYFLEKTSAYSQAEEYYQRSISIAKEAGAAHNNYGAFLCRRGRYAQAEAQFNLAAADQNYIKPANAYENAGLCALLIPDKKMAINYFEKALQKNPNMPTSMLQLGQIYYQDRNYESSYKYLQQFLRDNEPTAESLWLAIQLAYQRGDYNSAASYGMLLKSQYANSTQYQQYIKLKAAKG